MMNTLASKVTKFIKTPFMLLDAWGTEDKQEVISKDFDYIPKGRIYQRPVNEIPAEVDFSKLRFLVSENYEPFINIHEIMLREAGVRVIDYAMAGTEVLERFTASKEGHYAVVLLDVYLPDINGFEVARLIRELKRGDAKSVITIAISSGLPRNGEYPGYVNGVDGFMSKPLDMDRMRIILEKYL